MSFIVGIDGPAGSGKGTVAKKVAKILNLTNIDTGITYRCVALQALNENIEIGAQARIDPKTKQRLIKIAESIKIQIKNEDHVDRVFLNGADVTEKIRSKEVTAIVSRVSSIPEVRYKMMEVQRKLAERKKCYCGRQRYLYMAVS